MFNTAKVIRELSPPLKALFLTTLLYRSGTMAFPFFAVYLGLEGRYSLSDVSILVGLFGAGALTADLVIGWILKHFSASQTIVVSLITSSALLTLVPTVDDIIPLMVLTYFWGMAYEAFTPAAYSETARCSQSTDRKIAFSCNRLAVNVGMAIGPLVGSLLFTTSPLSLFYINAFLNVIALMTYYLAVRSATCEHTENAVEAHARGTDASSQEERLHGNEKYGFSRIIAILISVMPVHIAYALPPTFIAVYIIKYTSLPAYYVGAIFFVNAMLVILFEIPLNYRMKQWSSFNSMCLGFFLAGMGFALMYVTSPGPVILLATVVWSVGEMIIFPSITHYVSEISTSGNMNRNLGLYSAGVNIGVMVTPAIALYLSTPSLGLSPWLIVGGSLMLLSLVLKLSANINMLWYKEA